MNSEPRTAFVIDALPSLGGGEKVLFAALEAVPRADVFSLTYNRPIFRHTPLGQRAVHTSFLDVLPLAHTHHRLLLPLMPFAAERLDLSAYDQVLCFSYAVAHGVRPRHGARHLTYMFTPMRYAWRDLNLNGIPTRKNLFLEIFMRSFRAWDKKAAARVHQFASISQAVSTRIASAYQRASTLIYPPVEVERFTPASQRADYYITVTRLVPHKRIDLLVRACTRLRLPLVVVGTGSELPRLKQLAGPTIRFTGFQTDAQVADLLNRARGFLCATEEDFGIALVEAQAAGCPVLAFGRGGALETIVPGLTGLFFPEQTLTSLLDGLQRFEARYTDFSPRALVENAQRFNTARFRLEFVEFLQKSQSDQPA